MTEEGQFLKQRRILIATWLALAVVLVIQAQPFTYAYRRSADDAVFLDALAGGWAGIERLTLALSFQQGRLGLLAAVPLNVLGAYLADQYWARLAFVLMHLGVFVLFATYVSRLLAANITYPLVILLVTLQPVEGVNDYMPPISYPLQNTVPLLMLFAARLTLQRADGHRQAGGLVVWLARLGFLIALVITEYTFLVGTAALACEYLSRWARVRREGSASATATLRVLIDRRFAWDASSVAVAVVSYAAFRYFFPSTYEGNVIDGAAAPWRIVVTTLRHVHAGTIFARDLLDIGSIPRQAIVLATVVGLMTAVSSFFFLDRAAAIQAPGAVVAVCLLVIAYVTFPLAGNARQQAWCLEGGACGYLDSRISYLVYGLIVLCLVALALRSMPSHRAAHAMIVVLSGLLGLLAAASYAYNLRDGLVYANDARAWHRANLMACHPDLQTQPNRRLVRMIDPDSRVRFHPGTDRARFWRAYLGLKSREETCSTDGETRQAERRLLSDSEPILQVGRTVQFSRPSAGRFLGSGWSAQEPPGIWSDGTRAELVFLLPPDAEARPMALEVGFNVYIRPSLPDQTIAILVDGQRVETWTIARASNDGRVHERTIPLAGDRRPNQEIEVTFQILTPRQPSTDREIYDTRQLGMFLRWLVLEPRSP